MQTDSSGTTSTSGAVIAGNCHKLPQSMFKRRLISVDEITSNLLVLLRVLTVQLGVQQVRRRCYVYTHYTFCYAVYTIM
jgi:hypothetical protein